MVVVVVMIMMMVTSSDTCHWTYFIDKGDLDHLIVLPLHLPSARIVAVGYHTHFSYFLVY